MTDRLFGFTMATEGGNYSLKKKIFFIVVTMFMIFLLLYAVKFSSLFQLQKILMYAKKSDTIQMGKILDFHWDEAFYVSGYGAGELIKQKYGVEFTIESMQEEELRRILFFQNGKLVKIISYRHFEIDFYGNVDHWFSDTVFRVCWQNNKLYLEPENTIVSSIVP